MLIESSSNESSVVEEMSYPEVTIERSNERINRTRVDDELLEPRVAAVEMMTEFKRIAAALSPRDASTQDDLVQEMCLAALECTAANKRSYYTWLAGWRAKDYLRWWLTPMARQEPIPEFEDDDEPSAA